MYIDANLIMMKKPFIYLLLVLSLAACKNDYNNKQKEIDKSKVEEKGFGGAKTEPSRGTVVSEDSLAAENPTNHTD